MKILSPAEEDAILVYYDRGWSFAEIEAELGALRAEKFKREMRAEVISIIAHRGSPVTGCEALHDIRDKRLKRGDIMINGRLTRRY